MPAVLSPRLRLTISWPALVPFLALVVLALGLGGTTGAQGGTVSFDTPWQAPAPAPATAPGAVSADLARLAGRSPSHTVQTIVQLQPGVSPALVRARVTADGGTVLRTVPLINGLAVRGTAADAAALADLQGVRAVSLNAKVVSSGMLDPTKLESAYNQSVRAEKAWAAGYTGKGIGVAVVDSGLAGGLPDFRTSDTDARSRGVVSAVVNPQTADAKDSYGHGTHVAGLIAGNGFSRNASDPLYGKYAGAAPDGNLIAVKADNGRGQTDVLSLIDGLHFVVTHAAKYNIRVVNLSVRASTANSYKTDPLDAAVEAVWLHGIVVVAAAGNLGAASDAVKYAPGNDPFVITVGGVDDQGTKGISDDVVAGWSSHGTTQDGFAKPDVLAPGAHMVGPLAPGSAYATACPACVVDGQYLRIGGTSMAAAVVSGAVADVLQAHPDWTPDQVKATLMKRSRAVSDSTGAVVGDEVALDRVLFSKLGAPEAPANQGLTPNSLIDPATGTIKANDESWAASSWGASSWGASSWGASSWGSVWTGAQPAYTADWAAESFTGTSLSPAAFNAGDPQQCWQLARVVAGGWGASSWGASSWGAVDMDAAKRDCDAASQAAASGQASSWGASSWGASSWGASSWGASSWGASSWGASSWGASSWGASSWGASSWGATSWATAWDK